DKITIKFQKNGLVSRAIIHLQNIPFQQGGTITFVFSMIEEEKEEELASYKISLKPRESKITEQKTAKKT
ncbi:MAG: hypothetical protein EAZ95_10540, partial [Bacteroidetes bacterium]